MALANSPENPQPLRAVVAATKDWVERLGAVWVEAQLIQLTRRAGAATHFLTLRDKLAEVSVRVSISTAVLDAAGPLTEGTGVTAWVKPTLWSQSGSLTFECRDIRPAGEGRLLAQLDQRKRLLQAEGLFDPALKRRLPFLPRRIGLITGDKSAAERDVVENVRRRWPAAVLEIRYALMQGPSCAEQVVAALAALDRHPEVDVIIVARGGGSIEDLLPFSDEGLARAVHRCRTPVVSAIGHESDTPILDLVADLRASTPTDAAKRVVPDAAEEANRVAQARERIRTAAGQRIDSERRWLADLVSRPVLKAPTASLDLHSERLTRSVEQLRRATDERLREGERTIEHALQRVRSLSPKATLARGYAILVGPDGSTVAKVGDTRAGDNLLAHLSDGQLDLAVLDVHQEER